jgi:uncharacterized SAM-binding protein YcdF (DUF218 family)
VAPRSRWRLAPILAIVLVVAAVVWHAVWLGWLGRALVRDEGPAKADLAVVLAGDYSGGRIVKGAELVRAGYVPAVLVSGPAGFYDTHECDLAIAYAIRRGYPAQWFLPFPHSANSTREEEVMLLGELRRRRIRSFLLVTSTYHSARAARTWRAVTRAMGGGPEMRVVTAPDEQHFQADSWWRFREGRKTTFLEWSKTLASVAGI